LYSLQGKDHIAHTANTLCLFLQIDVAFKRQKLIQTELRTNKIKSPFIVQQNNTDIKPLKPGHNSWTDGRTDGQQRAYGLDVSYKLPLDGTTNRHTTFLKKLVIFNTSTSLQG
jgi:hypothetical protein